MDDIDEKTKQVVETMSNFVNNFSCDEEGFVKAMSYEHRTLQQSFTKLCMLWLENCAKEEYRFDDRNKASHMISKEMIDAFRQEKERQLPNHWKGVKPSQFLPMI